MNDGNQPDQASDNISSAELSEFEFTMITFFYGFSRWVEMCMNSADVRGLKALDILVLHATQTRAHGFSPNEIAATLNIDDMHLVAYSIKKLLAAELVKPVRDGRHQGYVPTPAGEAACRGYLKIREDYLLASLRHLRQDRAEIRHAGRILRLLTGLYDQAGRFAVGDAASRRQIPRPPVRTKR